MWKYLKHWQHSPTNSTRGITYFLQPQLRRQQLFLIINLCSSIWVCKYLQAFKIPHPCSWGTTGKKSVFLHIRFTFSSILFRILLRGIESCQISHSVTHGCDSSLKNKIQLTQPITSTFSAPPYFFSSSHIYPKFFVSAIEPGSSTHSGVNNSQFRKTPDCRARLSFHLPSICLL